MVRYGQAQLNEKLFLPSRQRPAEPQRCRPHQSGGLAQFGEENLPSADPTLLTKKSRDLGVLAPFQPTTAEFSRLDSSARQDSVIDDQQPSTLHTPVDDPTDAKMKFLKVGRVAIITRGRYAGKKVRNSTPRFVWREQRCGATGLGKYGGG